MSFVYCFESLASGTDESKECSAQIRAMKLKDWDKSTLKKWEKLQTSQQEKLQTVSPQSTDSESIRD